MTKIIPLTTMKQALQNIDTLLYPHTLSTALQNIGLKVKNGERINKEEALFLFENADLSYLGILANFIREQKHGDYTYFNRNFHVEPTNPADKIACYNYDGVEVTAAVRHGAIFGCQFHPEKSGPVGLRIIAAFLGV